MSQSQNPYFSSTRVRTLGKEGTPVAGLPPVDRFGTHYYGKDGKILDKDGNPLTGFTIAGIYYINGEPDDETPPMLPAWLLLG